MPPALLSLLIGLEAVVDTDDSDLCRYSSNGVIDEFDDEPRNDGTEKVTVEFRDSVATGVVTGVVTGTAEIMIAIISKRKRCDKMRHESDLCFLFSVIIVTFLCFEEKQEKVRGIDMS